MYHLFGNYSPVFRRSGNNHDCSGTASQVKNIRLPFTAIRGHVHVVTVEEQNHWQSGLPKVPNLGKPLFHQGRLLGSAPLGNRYSQPYAVPSPESNPETNGFVTVEEYRFASSGNLRRTLGVGRRSPHTHTHARTRTHAQTHTHTHVDHLLLVTEARALAEVGPFTYTSRLHKLLNRVAYPRRLSESLIQITYPESLIRAAYPSRLSESLIRVAYPFVIKVLSVRSGTRPEMPSQLDPSRSSCSNLRRPVPAFRTAASHRGQTS